MIPFHIILDIDELWGFYVIPLLAALAIAYLEYIHRRDTTDLHLEISKRDGDLRLLDHRLRSLEDAETPDTTKIEARLAALEGTVRAIKQKQDEYE